MVRDSGRVTGILCRDDPHDRLPSATIYAKLVRYRADSEYPADPVVLDGDIVLDDEHGWVLEIVLPQVNVPRGESAIFIPIAELKKLK
jgi:hypothetical protein